MTSRKEKKAFLYIALGVALLGTGPIFVKSVQAHGVLVGFYRLLFASLMMAVPAWLMRQPQPEKSKKSKQEEWGWSVLGGVCFAFNIGLWCSALNYTSASAVTLLDNTAPVWVGLVSWLLLGLKQQRNFWLGLVITLIGAALMIGMDFNQGPSGQVTGNLIALASGFAYGMYILVTHRARRIVGSFQYSFRVNVFGSLVLLMAGAGLGLFNQMLSAQAYFLIFLMALSSQVIAWLLVNHALGDLPAAAASIALVGQPIVTTLWAWLLLGEVPTSLQAVGGLVCLAGILIVQLSSTRRIESQATIGGLE